LKRKARPWNNANVVEMTVFQIFDILITEFKKIRPLRRLPGNKKSGRNFLGISNQKRLTQTQSHGDCIRAAYIK